MKLVRSILSNLLTLLLSFLLALLILTQALQVEDPIRNQFLQIQVDFVGQPENSILLEPSRQTVQIFFEGPASEINQVTASDFSATIDLSGVPYGRSVSVPIQVQSKEPTIEIQGQAPEQTSVTLEQLVERDVPVELEVRGSVALGYTQGDPLIEPESITVSGTASQIEPLQFARVTVFLNNERETVRRSPQPIFYNNQGQVASVSGLEMETEQVEVTIPVNESAGFAEMFINVDLVGDPAPGYRLLDVNVDPPSVLVKGRPTQLRDLNWVQTEPIDITGLTEPFRSQVALALPEGISLTEVEEIFVDVEIEPLRTTSIFNRTPVVQGLAPDLEAEVETETVRVILFGPLPILNSLLEEEIQVVVDLFGLQPGSYNLEPDVIYPEQRDIELRSLQPAQVTVMITETQTTTAPITGTQPVTDTSLIPAPPELDAAGSDTAVPLFPILSPAAAAPPAGGFKQIL
jgi:YbbR domain-containing protein